MSASMRSAMPSETRPPRTKVSAKVLMADSRSGAASRADEGVAPLLAPDGAGRAVPRVDGRALRERVEVLLDRCGQLLRVAPGEVGAPDRAGEQRIADQRGLVIGVVEGD